MAEEENKKKGRLATAVLAGSALAFSSFAIGAPAALAQGESPSPEPTESVATESESPEEEVRPDSSATTPTSDETSEDSDAEDEATESAEPSESVPATSEATSTEPSSEATDEPEFSTFQELNPEYELMVSPGEIALEDFIGDPEDGSGVTHTVTGLTPNTTIEYFVGIAESPTGIEGTAESDAEGNAEFVVVAPDDSFTFTGDLFTSIRYEGGDALLTSESFTILDSDDGEDDPAVNPQMELDWYEASPIGSVTVTGTGFTPLGQVELSLDGSSFQTLSADKNGEINSEITIPRDIAPGDYDLTAVDLESDEEVSVPFTVLDELTDPRLRADTDQIALSDFVGDPDEGAGVNFRAEGLEPNTSITYIISSPVDVEDVTLTATVDEDGVARFTVYGPDTGGNLDSYIRDYSVVVEYEDEAEETQELGPEEFTVVADEDHDDNGGETPVVDPDIDLNVDNAYPGETVSVSGSGFSADGNVEFRINPPVGETVADSDGEFNAEVTIPEDIDPGEHTFTALDVESGEEATVDFTVNDPADQVTEPALSIDPERIELDDFIGEEDDDNGVVHTVVGLEAGADYTYAVSGPEGVNDFEQSGTANEDGVAEFVIHGYEVSNPAVYLGDYTTVVNSVDQDGTDVELTGNFSVVSDDGSAGDGSGPDGSGDYTGDPVDMNGSALAQTGATSGQLGLIAGALLLMGGAFVVFANRGRLFGRKH